MTVLSASVEGRCRGRNRWLGRRIIPVLLSLALLAFAAGPLAGQLFDPYVSIAPQAGVAIPTGGLDSVVDQGPSFGVRVSSWFTPRFAFMGDVSVDMLPGASLSGGTKAPDMRLWHFTIGAESNLLPPSLPLSLIASLGTGITAFSSDPYRPTPETASTWRFEPRQLTLQGGVQIGFNVTPSITVFADGQAYQSRIKQDETQVLAMLDPKTLGTFESAGTYPIRFGIRARF